MMICVEQLQVNGCTEVFAQMMHIKVADILRLIMRTTRLLNHMFDQVNERGRM